jgi:hypothetical protein
VEGQAERFLSDAVLQICFDIGVIAIRTYSRTKPSMAKYKAALSKYFDDDPSLLIA